MYFSSLMQNVGYLLDKEWVPLMSCFKNFIVLTGCLDTVFPGTYAMDFDFSIQKW